MKKKILILASIALLAGCNKENSIFSPNGGLKSSVAESSITADDKDPTNYMKLTDYLPSSQNLIYEERIEFLKYAYNESPTYRDRNLNEVMFLFEAGINMDMNHLAIPLNKFKIEQTFVDINIENGKIPAASIKEGFVAIKEYIKAQGLKRRYVGMLDIEPVRIIGNKVRLRAGLYTGEPIEENKLKVSDNYSKPYGDMNFIDVDGLTLHGIDCDNIDPEDNAAFDLTGRFYNNGSYDVYASNNLNYTFNGTQWTFNTQYTLNIYGVPIAATTDRNPWWQNMYTYVNVHKDNWPLKYSHKDFYGNLIPGRRSGEIEVIHEDDTKSHQFPTMTTNSDILPNLDILHGYTTKFKVDMNFWPLCSNHNNYTVPGPNGETFANQIFYRDYSFFDAGAHSFVASCISGCEFNDLTDWYTLAIRALSLHQGPYLIPNMSSNKSMVGAEVHPCFFVMYTGLRDNVPNTRRNHFGLAHFLFPTYGDKVNFMKD